MKGPGPGTRSFFADARDEAGSLPMGDEERARIRFDEAVEAMRTAFVELAHGRAKVQPREVREMEGVRLNTMSALIPALGVCGAKVYTGTPAGFDFVTVLFSMPGGRYLGTVDANALSRLRTVATSALAAEFLAREDTETLAIFGTGVQAGAHAEGLARRFRLRRILVVGRARAEAFARETQALTGVETRVAGAREALAEADLVVTATRSREPLFDGRWLREGTTILAIGSSRPDAAELDAQALARSASIVVEGEALARHEAGDLLRAAQAGVDPWSKVVELGALAAGRHPGRVAANEIHVFESLGSALEDVAIAALAHRNTRGTAES